MGVIDYMTQEKKRVYMAVTNDLETDQRVHRACMALHEAGWQVTLVGRLLPESKPLVRPYATCRMRLLFRKSVFFYGEYNLRLFVKLLFIGVDLLYANDSDTLPAVYCVARLRRKALFFDAHELFPEVPELVQRPWVKRVWEHIEGFFFPRLQRYRYGAASTTVCQSIADYYQERYGLSMRVVRNVPMPYDRATVETVPITQRNGRKLLLYQGAVNVGRGVELLVDAMSYLEDCLLLIIGTGDIIDAVRERVRERGVADRVRVPGRMEPAELRRYTCEADLGMSLLDNTGLSYYYSFPNRIADFAQAHVPVLATDFPEIHRVVCHYRIGTLLPEAPCTAEQLAGHIRAALQYWQALPSAEKELRFAVAAGELNWQHDKEVLLAAIGDAIKN